MFHQNCECAACLGRAARNSTAIDPEEAQEFVDAILNRKRIAELEAKLAAERQEKHDALYRERCRREDVLRQLAARDEALQSLQEALKVARKALRLYSYPDFGIINNNHVSACEALTKIEGVLK